MRLKDQLILREVAGQYVIVPTGKRVQEIPNIVYISASAAYLWEYMKNHSFTREKLVDLILEKYTGVTKDEALEDIEEFMSVLQRNNILEPEPGDPVPECGIVRIVVRKDAKS